jgi:hypothetical protein
MMQIFNPKSHKYERLSAAFPPVIEKQAPGISPTYAFHNSKFAPSQANRAVQQGLSRADQWILLSKKGHPA